MTAQQALRSPAIRRGVLSVIAAIVVLAFPGLLTKSVWLLASVGAVLFGSIELGIWWRAGRKDNQELIRAVVLILGGVSVVVFRDTAVRAVELILAVVLIARSALGLYTARKRWKAENEDPFWDLLKAVVALLLAAALILIPETLIGLVLSLFALGWIVAGLVVLINALRENDSLAPAPADLVGVLREKSMAAEKRSRITDAIFEGTDSAEGTLRFVALMSFATVIAAFGVEADSTAVVIGAMLIAPLMSPIMALSAALLMGWTRRATTSGWRVVLGVGIGVGGSFLTALISPALVEVTQNSQVLSRTSPTLLDLMIALAAGAAGAYAMTHPKVSNSLPGVAIAVALVPPLAVVGVSLEAGELAFATGAFLLFLTNLVGIVVAAGVVFVLSGYSPWFRVERATEMRRRSFGLVGVALVLVAFPLAIIGDDIIDEASANSEAEASVETWLGPDSEFEVFSVQVRTNDVEVTIVGPGESPDPDALATDLALALDRPVDLELRVVPESTHSVSVDEQGQPIDDT